MLCTYCIVAQKRFSCVAKSTTCQLLQRKVPYAVITQEDAEYFVVEYFTWYATIAKNFTILWSKVINLRALYQLLCFQGYYFVYYTDKDNCLLHWAFLWTPKLWFRCDKILIDSTQHKSDIMFLNSIPSIDEVTRAIKKLNMVSMVFLLRSCNLAVITSDSLS